MSTKVIADQSIVLGAKDAPASASLGMVELGRYAAALLSPLASLRLTVFLLVTGVFVVWIATLAQTRRDFWAVKQQHFPELTVFVPFQDLLPPAWFPSLQNLPPNAGFLIPSGFSLLTAMLINLFAAHLLRIRIQAKGSRLAIGVVTAIVGLVLTWLIIFSGQNPHGFQAQPPISYQTMWIVMQVMLLGLALGLGAIAFTLPRPRVAERVVSGGIGCLLLVVLALVWWVGEKAFIGDSAMRILWQLIQATVAGLAMLFGCQFLFRRKGGIVLVHLGIAMLMANEIYVTVTNVEQRMSIVEGQSASHTVDIRSVELVVATDQNESECEFITIPRAKLLSGERISHPDLPFDLQCVRFIPNTDIAQLDSTSDSPATHGIGKRFEALPKPVSSGTDPQQTADLASAYVTLWDKQSGVNLGTYLVSQILYEEGIFDDVAVGKKSYFLGLRFQHYYKPYSLQLLDVSRVDYVGTSVAKSYESKFLLTDPTRGLHNVQQRVYMNNPLRYGDETFYQSGHNFLPSGREYTVLQIVKNRGWMIPYVACMFVVIGLIAQFGSVLLGFLEKNRTREARVNSLETSVDQLAKSGSKSLTPLALAKGNGWILAGCVGLIVLGYVGYTAVKAARTNVEKTGKRLDRFGAIPLAYEGRVQPLESLARNTAREMGNRETVTVVGGKKVPAILWFADFLYDPSTDGKYQILRIDDLNLLAALDLPQRSGFKYSLEELTRAREKLDALVADLKGRDELQWTAYDKRVDEVSRKLTRLEMLRSAFGGRSGQDEELDPLMRLSRASQLINADAPLALPTNDPSRPWQSLASTYELKWLQEMANKHMAGTANELAQVLIDEYLVKPQIVERIINDPELAEMIKKTNGDADPDVLRKQILARWNQFPPELLASFSREVIADFERRARLGPGELLPKFRAMVNDFFAKNGAAESIFAPLPPLAEQLTKLNAAYLQDDPAEFNQLVEKHLETMSGKMLTKSVSRGIDFEVFYNRLSPFYLASVLYLVAVALSIAAWFGRGVSFVHAASVVNMIAIMVQIAGIVLRVIISGRPPVTSLYSSFVFVSAVSAILLLIVERMTRLGLGNLLAALSSFTALLWAWTISVGEGDTFTVLVAVLDTQFWLSTHVICISVGYAATMVAGLLGIGYLIGYALNGFTSRKGSKNISTQIIYGIVCFALLFSFFGTVLGGLWADDSWGRFWGWDPKENGALMIVLWNAAILHARWAGLARDRGIAAMAVLGCAVTIWSWEGVNQLGVGLHSYAFSEDRLFWVFVFAGTNIAIAAAAYVVPWLIRLNQRVGTQS